MNYQRIMLRELKKNNHLLALNLDSYNPHSDSIPVVDITSHIHYTGRYIQLRDRSSAFRITEGSKKEKQIRNLIANDGIIPVFTDKFSNPNKLTKTSER